MSEHVKTRNKDFFNTLRNTIEQGYNILFIHDCYFGIDEVVFYARISISIHELESN